MTDGGRGKLVEGSEIVYDCVTSSARIIDVAYPPSREYEPHEHDRSYLCLTVRGGYEEWTGARRSLVRGGDDIVYAEGSRHAVRTGSEGARILHVTDPGGSGWRGDRPLRSRGILWQLAAATARLARGETDGDELLHLESLAHELGSAPVDGADGWLLAVRDHIREAGTEAPSLAELAERAGRHPAHVARAFRARWGMTPGEYGRRLRVAMAVRLLERTGRSTATVALDSGFADQSHLGRWMVRYVGLTPAEVRRKGGGERAR